MFYSESYNSIEVISAVVTGTHSAGKTTLVSDYVATLNNRRTIGGESQDALYYYSAGSLTYNHLEIPVVTIPEAATIYALERRTPEVLTTSYTFDDQVRMELLADTLGTEGSILAESLFDALNPAHKGKRVALLLSDRTGLDGAVYSGVRLPAQEQENVNLYEVMKNTGGMLIGSGPHTYQWRQAVRQAIAQSDIAFIVDHEEVPFESSELRLADLEFRNRIATQITKAYNAVLGTDMLVKVSGTREERVQIVSKHLRTLLADAFA